MKLRDRIGVDVGRKLTLEDAVEWAAEHRVRYIDIQLDTGANALPASTTARAAAVRRACERHGVHLGLHTSSAVNVAEYAPYVGDAVDRYLEAYVEMRAPARRRMDRHACRLSLHLGQGGADGGRAASG